MTHRGKLGSSTSLVNRKEATGECRSRAAPRNRCRSPLRGSPHQPLAHLPSLSAQNGGGRAVWSSLALAGSVAPATRSAAPLAVSWQTRAIERASAETRSARFRPV